jgi:hypothetical protein
MLAQLKVMRGESMMSLWSNLTRVAVAALALVAAACSMTRSGTLNPGMSPDQTIQSMGQPDLKDNIADPRHTGVSVLRFVWLDSGKAAIFGPDDKLINVQTVETNTKQKVEQQAKAADHPPESFDPIETPLNYLFFPVKAGLTYLGAGANCVGGGGCQAPELPPPGAS